MAGGRRPAAGVAPPHSSETERAVLAAVLLAPDRLPQLATLVRAEDFFLERHQVLYRAMLALHEAGRPIDLLTMRDQLERAGGFERAGGVAFLAGLDLELPDLERAPTYATIVRERAHRRRLITACQELARDGFDPTHPLEQLLGRGEGVFGELRAERRDGGAVTLHEGLSRTVAQLHRRADGERGAGLATGLADLDALYGGLGPGNLVILAGRPGMGKSALALNLAQHVALRSGLGVGYFSLEMSLQELLERLLASESGLPLASVRSGRLHERQWAQLYEIVHRAGKAPLFVDDTPAQSLDQLLGAVRGLHREHPLELIVVDYLQLMGTARRAESRQLEVAEISRRLKLLAKELEIPVLALSQLSREPERRSSKRPQLSDLRDSGAIEQDADQVLFIYRRELYEPDNPDVSGEAELIVAKHRHGPTGVVRLVYLAETVTFRCESRGQPPEGPPSRES